MPNPKWANLPPERLCRAHKSNGDPCSRPPVRGATVCTHHGGRAGQVKRKAKQRLEEAADRMARELLRMADGSESEAVKLAAIKDALDRAGLNPKQAHEISVSTKPWETILSGVVAGERSTPAPEREARDGDVIDVEWFESEVDEPPSCRSCGRQFPDQLPPELDAYPEQCGDCRAAPSAEQRESPTPPPAAPLVTWEEGVAAAAKVNRRAAVVPIHDRRKRAGRGEFAG